MKHVQTFDNFLNESYSQKKVSFEQWLKDLLSAWPFIKKDFQDAGIDPQSLTADNFYETIKEKGELYNKDWALYRMGKYISVEKKKNYQNRMISGMNASRELSSYGYWSDYDDKGTVSKNPHPNIDTSREGT